MLLLLRAPPQGLFFPKCFYISYLGHIRDHQKKLFWAQKFIRFQPPQLWIRPQGDFDPLSSNFEVPAPLPGLKQPKITNLKILEARGWGDKI